jgi:glycosyltransferase involved in cell wall biosynthesis
VTGISVIVPTHGRERMVAALLESLDTARQAATASGTDSEVIVVDSSTGAIADAIDATCRRWRANYVRSTNDVRKKRNLGYGMAKFPIVMFTDSDCVVDASALVEHARTHARLGPRYAGVLGLTQWSGAISPVWKVLQYHPATTAAFSFAAWFETVPWGTCTNLSIRRDALDRVGGFDERFPMPLYGEDVDLGMRLTKAGLCIATARQAIVLHSRESMDSYGRALRKAFRCGRADAFLCARYPDDSVIDYPGPVLTTGMVAMALIAAKGVAGILPALLVIPWMAVGQAALTVATTGGGLGSLPWRALAVLLDMAFEAGRLSVACRRWEKGAILRRFVYVHEQLVAERRLRVFQMYLVACGLTLIALFRA